MTTELTVAFDTGATTTGSTDPYAAHRTALGSLPRSFRVLPTPPADVLVTAATGPGWLARVTPLLSAATRAVLITGQGPASAGDLRGLAGLATDKRLIVAVDNGYADDAAWQSALPDLGADLAGLVLIDSVITVPVGPYSLPHALTDQLAVIESLTGPLARTSVLSIAPGHYVVSAAAGAVPVSLSGTACAAEPGSLELDLVGARARWHVRFSSRAAARPTEITRFDATGARSLRPLFQGSRRACWLRLFDDVTSQAFSTEPLDSLDDRVARAAKLLAGS
jgi:hypothetical protein